MSAKPDIGEIERAGGALPVKASEGLVAFATVHPQWGGYCFPCVVSFQPPTDGDDAFPCFDVQEWHDGDFATDDVQAERHYCDPTQILGFAVVIMEQMHALGYRRGLRDVGDLIRRLEVISPPEPAWTPAGVAEGVRRSVAWLRNHGQHALADALESEAVTT
jgi:hypothetical protein